MLIKYSGKYIEIYFNLKITFHFYIGKKFDCLYGMVRSTLTGADSRSKSELPVTAAHKLIRNFPHL